MKKVPVSMVGLAAGFPSRAAKWCKEHEFAEEFEIESNTLLIAVPIASAERLIELLEEGKLAGLDRAWVEGLSGGPRCREIVPKATREVDKVRRKPDGLNLPMAFPKAPPLRERVAVPEKVTPQVRRSAPPTGDVEWAAWQALGESATVRAREKLHRQGIRPVLEQDQVLVEEVEPGVYQKLKTSGKR